MKWKLSRRNGDLGQIIDNFEHVRNSFCSNRQPSKFLSREMTRSNISLRQIILAAIRIKEIEKWEIKGIEARRNVLTWSDWSPNQNTVRRKELWGRQNEQEDMVIHRVRDSRFLTVYSYQLKVWACTPPTFFSYKICTALLMT